LPFGLGFQVRLYGKDDQLIQEYSPCHVTNLTILVQLIAKDLQNSINWLNKENRFGNSERRSQYEIW